jgi:hypothetical protein
MRSTLRWLQRAFIVLSLAACFGVILLRFLTRHGSGDLYYSYIAKPPNGLISWAAISTPGGRVWIEHSTASIAEGSREYDAVMAANRMKIEDHSALDFYFDWGTAEVGVVEGSIHSHWGFAIRVYRDPSNQLSSVGLLAPHWLLALLFAIPPLWSFTRLQITTRRSAKRRRRNQCQSCGYDLRASPTTCPECNTPVPKENSPRPRRDWIIKPLAAILAAALLVGLGQYYCAHILWHKINADRWTENVEREM